MANKEHLDRLRQGVEAWNQWSILNCEVNLDLYAAKLRRAKLRRAKLRGDSYYEKALSDFTHVEFTLKNRIADLYAAELRGAKLSRAELRKAKLREFNLRRAELSRAELREFNLRRADLSGATLSGFNLREFKLSRAKLSRAKLSEAKLNEAKLSEANLYKADLSGADLSGADLSGANLYKADLSGADLSGADLSEAKLSGADLSEANLYKADLSGADLSGADLSEAKLSGANLSYVTLSRVNLYKADLSEANLRYADLREARMYEANLYKADLSGADLRGAGLHGATLNGADLSRTNLREINLREVNLSGINLRGAKLYGADLYKAELSYTDLSRAKLSGAHLSYADLSRAKLSGAHLSYADLSYADLSYADLSYVNLSRVNLNRTTVLSTNFEKAVFTGACLEDWNTNSTTNFEGTICDYVYLKLKYAPFNRFAERRPRAGSFQSGEFATLFQQAVDTVDLIFKDGIDWQAFFQSFQDFRSQYMDQDLSIQAIEKKRGGAFVIRMEVPPEVDKTVVESRAKELYASEVKALEAQYDERLRLQGKHLEDARQTIEVERREKATLTGVMTTMANSQQGPKYDMRGAQIAGGIADIVNGPQFGGTINNYGPNTEDITRLLTALRDQAQTFPTNQKDDANDALDLLERDLADEQSDQSRIGRRLKKLVALGAAIGTIASGAAAVSGDVSTFTGNVIELTEQLGIPVEQVQLPLSGTS